MLPEIAYILSLFTPIHPSVKPTTGIQSWDHTPRKKEKR